MTTRLLVGSLALMLAAAALTARPQASGDGKSNPGGLSPGKFVVHEQRVPIRIVLIGFDKEQINAGDLHRTVAGHLQAGCAQSTVLRPRRAQSWTAVQLQVPDPAQGPRLHRSLLRASRIDRDRGTAHPVSNPVQRAGHERPRRDRPGARHRRRRASSAGWRQHASQRRAGYTVYFVNWYGRNDFRFHVFTKKDDPDPDTGFNFGELAQSRDQLLGRNAASRTWFYDFSAGPEWNT